jgi:GAF domain-containing protein
MEPVPEKAGFVNCVDEVLITSELTRRPSRSPDYEVQSQAMLELGDELRDNPRNMLNKLAELAIRLCHADSAGISILASEEKCETFRWHAIAGRFAPELNGSLLPESSPAGTVVERNCVLLFHEPDRFFPELRAVSPRVYEALLAPWLTHDKSKGTLWVVAHTPEHRFDSEDARIAQILARFASAAHQATLALERAQASQADMEKRVEESAHLLSDTFRALRREMESRDLAECKRRRAERALRKSERRRRFNP